MHRGQRAPARVELDAFEKARVLKPLIGIVQLGRGDGFAGGNGKEGQDRRGLDPFVPFHREGREIEGLRLRLCGQQNHRCGHQGHDGGKTPENSG